MVAEKKRTWGYKCAVEGCFSIGGRVGICGKAALHDCRYCTAHGNHKCEHKIKIVEV